MGHYIAQKPWHKLIPTSQEVYENRRSIVKKLGIITGGLLLNPLLFSGCSNNKEGNNKNTSENRKSLGGITFNFEGMDRFYPADRNEKYVLDRPITDEYEATHKNNFYEFISREDPNIYNVYKFVSDFNTQNWKIEVNGLVNNPGTYYLEDLIKKFSLEERTYRFRCVERWAMAVPWTGFTLAGFVKMLAPKNNAKFIRMISYANADEMEGVRNLTHYPWPYFEGLRMDEAMNELSFLATGLYGKPIPKQNGAPVRLVVPWKYGYKNIKSIVKMEFTDKEPPTFWQSIAPDEYPFLSNVDPTVPHPRWSQAYENMLPDGEDRPTLPFNGYGEYVGHLYS